MPERLTSAGESALDNKDVKFWNRVKIGGVANTDVLSYGYSADKKFGAASLVLDVDNSDGQYAQGVSQIKLGDSITLEEGIYNTNDTLESFTKFTGIVRQTAPERSSGINKIRVTALDNICRLEDLDLDEFYESTKQQVYGIPTTVTIGGSKLLESKVETQLVGTLSGGESTITVDSIAGFDDPDGSYAKAYIEGDAFCYTGVDTTNSQLTGCVGIDIAHSNDEVVWQIMSDATATKNKASFYDFGYWNETQGESFQSDDFQNDSGILTSYWFHRVKNIAPTVLPIIVVRPKLNNTNPQDTLTRYEDPVWDGFSVGYAEGQVVFGQPIDITKYEVWAYFYYYPTSTIDYAEDIIEDMITATDGYGNTVFSTANISTSLSGEDGGCAIDFLVYNRDVMYIDEDNDGVPEEYAIGQVWFMNYSNITDTLSSGDFVIPSGKSISYINERHGRIILDSAVSSPVEAGAGTPEGSCWYNGDYNFKTTQATGIQVPFFKADDRKYQNRFDALSDFRKKLLPPNYTIFASGDGKIWGKYLQQKYTEDYEIKLKSRLNFLQDTNVYTRTKFYGYSGNPTNIMIKNADPIDGDAYVAYASNQPLMIKSIDGDYIYYSLPDNIVTQLSSSQILPNPHPIIWINGVRNRAWTVDGLDGQVWGHIYDQVGDLKVYKGIWFHQAIAENTRIRFYQGDTEFTGGLVTGSIYRNQLDDENAFIYDAEDKVYKWIPGNEYKYGETYIDKTRWDSGAIQAITSVSFELNYADSWEYIGNNTFKIKRNLLGEADIDVHDTSKWYDVSSNGPVAPAPLGTHYLKQPSDAGYWTSEGQQSYWNDGDIGENRYFSHKLRQNLVIPSSFDAPEGGGNTTNQPWISITIYTESYQQHLVSGIDFHHVVGRGLFNCNLSVYSGTASGEMIQWENASEDDWANTTAPFRIKFVDNEGNPKWVWTNEITVVLRGLETAGVNSGWRLDLDKLTEIDLMSPKTVSTVTADFWYEKYMTIPYNLDRLYDGLWSTQVMSTGYVKPTKGFIFTGWEFDDYYDKDNEKTDGQPIDAIDITGGFYIPNPEEPQRKYETRARYTLKYNTDGSANYLPISAETTNFELSSGETVSFEKDALGEDFHAKRLVLICEDVDKIEGFGPDKWVISLVEFAAYREIYIEGESKLIRTTKLTSATSNGDTTINVVDTTGFDSSGTIYIVAPGYNVNTLTYSGKTSTSFTGCSGVLARPNSSKVVESVVITHPSYSTEPTYGHMYDPDHLLTRIGDRVYKDTEIKEYLNTEEKIKKFAGMFLRELSNQITKASASVVARPDITIGDTVLVSDSENLSGDEKYFVETISSGSDGQKTLTLAQYNNYIEI